VAVFESGGGNARIYLVCNDAPKPRLGCD